MSQKRPDYFSGGYYHIYNRGAHQHSIIREPANFLFLLDRLKHYTSQLDLTLIAYCLMYNHYHFLVRQNGEQPAGLLPQRVFNSYSKAYNKRYTHSGTLFEDNYKIKQVQSTSYLLHLCRYIHINPVKDGFVSDPGDWLYSNYLEFIGQRPGTLYDPEFVRINFDTPANYRTFVFADLRARDLPPEVRAYLDEIEA